MSLQARQSLVNHPHTIFTAETQRTDLLDPNLTRTELIALLLGLVGQGHIILFTAVRTDHRDDSCLGFHSHEDGFCADVWPLNTMTPTDYANANDGAMTKFLVDAARSPWIYQIGLAGSANTAADAAASGRTEFADDGADHVHLGSGGV